MSGLSKLMKTPNCCQPPYSILLAVLGVASPYFGHCIYSYVGAWAIVALVDVFVVLLIVAVAYKGTSASPFFVVARGRLCSIAAWPRCQSGVFS